LVLSKINPECKRCAVVVLVVVVVGPLDRDAKVWWIAVGCIGRVVGSLVSA
jgi:hypothetical protein